VLIMQHEGFRQIFDAKLKSHVLFQS